MITVSSIKVRTFDIDHLDLFWTVEDTQEKLEEYDFFILRSIDGAAGPYNQIAGPFYNTYMFRDPEVQFLRGYLHSLNAILLNKRTDLTGLVIAWEALLNLYARNSWHVSADVADKIKLFIRVAEKFCDPIPPKNYSGAFAKFIIVMACDLAEKGDLPKSERKIFEEIRLKYYNDDGEQWQKWRSNGYTPK